jgi:hypothetical protein
MLIGATVLCFLVLLVLIADRFGAHVWHGGVDRMFYRCEECDLRYPRREIHDPRFQVCPSGHPVAIEPHSATAGVVGIFACLGFLTVAILFMVTGIVPVR